MVNFCPLNVQKWLATSEADTCRKIDCVNTITLVGDTELLKLASRMRALEEQIRRTASACTAVRNTSCAARTLSASQTCCFATTRFASSRCFATRPLRGLGASHQLGGNSSIEGYADGVDECTYKDTRDLSFEINCNLLLQRGRRDRPSCQVLTLAVSSFVATRRQR